MVAQNFYKNNNSRQQPPARRLTDLANDVKARINLADYIGHDVTLKKAGRTLKACCPFHDEKTPSFVVYPDTNTWRCFGACNEGGSIIDYKMKRDGLTASEAIKELAREIGADSGPARPARSITRLTPSTTGDEPPAATWQRAAGAAAKRAHDFLMHSDHPEARATREYLLNRGITHDDIEKYEIGYSPKWQSIGIKDDQGDIALAPGITIPIKADGQFWNIKVRRRVGDFGKALNITDRRRDGTEVEKYIGLRGHKSGIPFGADGLEAGRAVLIDEGEFDAIVMQEALPMVTVITVGSASTPIKSRILERLKSAGQIYTLFDNDAAGKNATPLKQLAALGSKALTLPEGVKDPTEYWQQGGDLATWYAAATRKADYWQRPPDAVDEIMLMRFKDRPDLYSKGTIKTLRLLFSANHAGLLNNQHCSVDDAASAAQQLGIKRSRRAIAKDMDELEILFLQKLVAIDSPIPPTFCKNSNRGRKAVFYRFISQADFINNLLIIARRCLKEKHIGDKTLARLEAELLAPLMGEEAAAALAPYIIEVTEPVRQRQAWQIKQKYERFSADMMRLANDLESPSTLELEPAWEAVDHRAAKIRAFVRQTGTTQPITRQQLARVAGCSVSHLPKVIKFAGIESTTHDDAYFEVNPTADLSKEIYRIHRENQCRVMNLTAKDGDRILEWQPLASASTAWVQEQRQRGRKVFAKATTGNTYRIVRDSPISSEPKPKVQRAPVPHYITSARREPCVTLPTHDYLKGHSFEWSENQLIFAVESLRGFQRRYVEGQLQLIDMETGESFTINDYRDLLPLLWVSQDDLAAQAQLDRNLDELERAGLA